MGTPALLIDFGGTLDADGVPWVDRFHAAYQDTGGAVSPPAFRRAFAESDDQLALLPGIDRRDYRQTVAAQSDLLADRLPDGDLLRSSIVINQLVDDAMAVASRNGPVLRELRRDYRLAVVSNFQGNLQPCLDQLGLGALFDVVSDSALIGVRKPDPRIFAITLAQLGCAAADCWMIGDSPPNDMVAGAAVGMRSCWIAPDTRPLPGIVPTARAPRFADVSGVIGR